MDRRKMILGRNGMGYIFANGTIGRRITQNTGLGDIHTFADVRALAQQYVQAVATAPPAIASQVNAMSGARTGAGQFPLYTNSQNNPPSIVSYYLSNANSTSSADADYDAISQGILNIQNLEQGLTAAPLANVQGQIQQILTYGQQFQQLLQSVPSSLTQQANAILAATTSYPQNNVTGIIKYYSGVSPSNAGTYIDRDLNFMASQLSALQALLSSPPPVPQTPQLVPVNTSGQPQTPQLVPVNTSGQPVYVPPPAPIPTTTPGTQITYVGPTGIPSVLASQIVPQANPTYGAVTTTQVAPSSDIVIGGYDFTAMLTAPVALPVIGTVPTYVPILGLVALYFFTRKPRSSSPAPASSATT